jgi:hypothetical protein
MTRKFQTPLFGDKALTSGQLPDRAAATGVRGNKKKALFDKLNTKRVGIIT